MLDQELLKIEEYGCGLLDDVGIQRRQEKKNRIEQLCADFNRNLRENDSGEFFTPEEVGGLPAKDREPTGSDGKEFYSHAGKYMTILRHVHSEDTRKRMFVGFFQRFHDNVPIFREIILLRNENARELGSTSLAATRIPYRIAESTEWVEKLLNDLAETLLPIKRAEFERVQEKKRRCLQEDSRLSDEQSRRLMPWDYLYYSALLDKEAQVDDSTIAEYFPLHHILSAMLDLFAKCIQLRFESIPNEELEGVVWHEDVQGWAVWDERSESKGDFLGYLFADLLNRPNKYKGNQSVNLQPVREFVPSSLSRNIR